MNTAIARFISYVLHPLLMPLYCVLMIFYFSGSLLYTINPKYIYELFLTLLIYTIVVPVLIAVLLRYINHVSSIEMGRRGERTLPFMATVLSYMLCFMWMKNIPLPKFFYMIVLGAAVAIIIATIINFVWKISIHMVGVGGLAGALYGISQLMLVDFRLAIILALLMCGVIGSARLSLLTHSPAQIYAGFLTGFFCEYMMMSV